MKKLFLVTIIISLWLSSCTPLYYIFGHRPRFIDSISITNGLDFREGKWILNDIEYISYPYPSIPIEELENRVVEDFTEYLGHRLQVLRDVRGALIPPRIPLSPDKEFLKNLKIGTSVDYFINIKANDLKNELPSMTISTTPKPLEDRVNIIFEVYDLNNQAIIYNQRVEAFTRKKEEGRDNRDVTFSPENGKLVMKSLNRILKKIKKNSFY